MGINNSGLPNFATTIPESQYGEKCFIVMTTNVNIATIKAGDIVNGETLSLADRILLVGQTDHKQDGPYLIGASAGLTVRASDELESGIQYPITNGTSDHDTIWQLTNSDPIVLGTTVQTWIKIALDTSLLMYKSALGANEYATTGTSAYKVQIVGDTNPRFEMLADGTMKWSTGSAVSACSIKHVAGQLQFPIAPLTADANADVLIQSTAATQVPLVVQGAAGQTDNLIEANDSAGVNTFLVKDGNGIAATSTDGLVLSNNTASLVGTPVQMSPRIRQRANVWQTSTDANDTWDFYQEVLPATAATSTASWLLKSSKNGAAATTVMSVNNAGGIACPAYSTFGGVGTGSLYMTGFGFLTTVSGECTIIGRSGATAAQAGTMGTTIYGSGRIAGTAVANPTPHATASNHTSNGTLITITTTAAHLIVAGQSITLAGWTWSDGGGSINGTYLVNTTPSTTTFTLNPATYRLVCPTTGTNPSVVGTIVVNALLQLGAAPVRPTGIEAVTVGGILAAENNAIAATSTDGIVLVNNTPATVGVPVQQSPRLRLRGSAWDTDGGVADTWDWRIEAQLINGNTTYCTLNFNPIKNGTPTAYNYQMTAYGQFNAQYISGSTQVIGGTLVNTGSYLSAGTMTNVMKGECRTVWHRYTWTNDMAKTGDVTVATLPAKTRVLHAYIVITTAATNMGAATVTATLGTDAEFDNLLVAGDLLATANTVYGKADAEMGASMPPTLNVGFLPSWTATTAVKVRFATDGAGGKTLADLLTCTGSVYLLTETLP
jgi:hypothetical protein